ncbi:hypothetical protein [Microtetraspora fusca]|uniref:Uncharacterized protein n=1 Tax=Microtetraspora fusca TaxID=1997 RepID=A0ABW6VCW5_MICFU|nr:hypothetical protein [Microtetraspora fusca]
MTEFLASVLAKAAFMLLEALIMRIVQSLVLSTMRTGGMRTGGPQPVFFQAA